MNNESHCYSCDVFKWLSDENCNVFDYMSDWKQAQFKNLIGDGLNKWDVICFERDNYDHYGIVHEIEWCRRQPHLSNIGVVHLLSDGILREEQLVRIWDDDGLPPQQTSGISSSRSWTRPSFGSSAGRKVKASSYADCKAKRTVYVDNRDDLMSGKRMPTNSEREDIVKRFLRTNVGFSKSSNNCEHWARYIRHGVKRSLQVENVQDNLVVGIKGAIAGTVVVSACTSRES